MGSFERSAPWQAFRGRRAGRSRKSGRAIAPTASPTGRTKPPIPTMAAPASASPSEETRAQSCTTSARPIASSTPKRRVLAAGWIRRRKRSSGSPTKNFKNSSTSRNPDAFFLKRAHQRIGVLAIARLDEELDFGRAHRRGAEEALVLDLDDVAAGFCNRPSDLGEAARNIGHGDAQTHQAAVAHESSHQHRGKHPAVDVAARDGDSDPFP